MVLTLICFLFLASTYLSDLLIDAQTHVSLCFQLACIAR
jgi:hypothetical protein